MTRSKARAQQALAMPRCGGRFERAAREAGFLRIAGLDEAGRGCLFGPVYAAAVILHPDRPIEGLRDSKQISPPERERLSALIIERAQAWAVASVDAGEIDRINIYQASRLAMKLAAERLTPPADYLLIDAMELDLDIPQRALVRGDQRCRSIAAASILAKVERDRELTRWHEIYPDYGLARHKGYGTPEHLRALERYGPTSQHRRSFAPVRLAGAQGSLFDKAAAACH